MLPEPTIVSLIMKFASQCGDPRPSALRYVNSTRGALGRATYNTKTQSTDAATPVVLVEATGHFRWRHSAPLGASPYSTGTAISLVISELTGAVISRSISPEPLDLSSLGQVHHPAVPR